MNLAFIGPLKHAGLALSIGLGACLNAALLYWQLRKKAIFQPQPGWLGFLLRLLLAVAIMAAALFGMLYWMPVWEQGNMLWRLLRLALVCAVGGGAYFLALGLMGFRLRDYARRTTV
jgi:putative peptidoglycan lipid II flippase